MCGYVNQFTKQNKTEQNKAKQNLNVLVGKDICANGMQYNDIIHA